MRFKLNPWDIIKISYNFLNLNTYSDITVRSILCSYSLYKLQSRETHNWRGISTVEEVETNRSNATETQKDKKMRKTETLLNNLRKTTATVIPPPRKSIKRMMFESFLAFVANLCSSEAISPEKIIGGDGNA